MNARGVALSSRFGRKAVWDIQHAVTKLPELVERGNLNLVATYQFARAFFELDLG